MINIDELKSAGIDTESLTKRLMGNTNLVKLFAEKFIEDKTYEKLIDAMKNKDMDAAEAASHTLKGMCGNMSINPLYELFTRQVNLIRAGEYDAAENMMKEIESVYSNVILSMQQWLDKQ